MRMDTSMYLRRIGLTRAPLADFEGLCELQEAHALTVPFENLDIHYHRIIRLDLPSIYDKVIHKKRGGFCYELNGLFHELLKALGFQVIRISAQVYSDTKKAFGPAFDHLANLVTLQGVQYIVDVGFGSFARHPILFQKDVMQHDAWGTFRVATLDHEFELQRIQQNQWQSLYRFTTKSRKFVDFAAMCEYQQHHPDSHFRQKKMITRPTPEGRITLTSGNLKITAQGDSAETSIESTAEFEAKLWEYFRIEM